MPTTQDLLEQEYMTLAPGIGVIPDGFRNKAYDKLKVKPGELGLGQLLASREARGGGDQMRSFLAGVAAGADPQELAKQLLGSDETPKRGRAAH